MSKHSTTKDGVVIHDFYLVFDGDSSIRLSRNEPTLDRAERSMFMQLKAPLTLWSRPILRGTIDVRSDGAPVNTTIDIRAGEAALKAALGVDIDLRVVESQIDEQ